LRYAGYYKGVHGDGLGGYHDGPAIETSPGNGAQFNGPYSIVMQKRTDVPDNPQGTMYVADNYNCLIRKISADGTTVSTLLGLQPGIPPRTRQ